MPGVPELIASLLNSLRAELGSAGVSAPAIGELLEAGTLAEEASDLLGRLKGEVHAGAVAEADAWESLIGAFVEGVRADESHAASVVQRATVQRLKQLVEELQRKWLVLLPVEAAVHDNSGVAECLSTASTPRVVVEPSANPASFASQIARARELLDLRSDSSVTLPEAPAHALFLIAAQGSPETALRRARSEAELARDALCFASHVTAEGRRLADHIPPPHRSGVADAYFIHVDDGRREGRLIRDERIQLSSLPGPIGDPKGRELYDQAARLLESCREGTKDGGRVAWRLARSIRSFSRGVLTGNRELRFLLLVVALEAVLSPENKEAISEELAVASALLVAESVGQRAEVHRLIKQAYNARSKFVHEGRLPSETLKNTDLAIQERGVFDVWAAVMRRLLPLAEAIKSDEEFFARLRRLKFGASRLDTFEMTL